jgi:hypothetical protein
VAPPRHRVDGVGALLGEPVAHLWKERRGVKVVCDWVAEAPVNRE